MLVSIPVNVKVYWNWYSKCTYVGMTSFLCDTLFNNLLLVRNSQNFYEQVGVYHNSQQVPSHQHQPPRHWYFYKLSTMHARAPGENVNIIARK